MFELPKTCISNLYIKETELWIIFTRKTGGNNKAANHEPFKNIRSRKYLEACLLLMQGIDPSCCECCRAVQLSPSVYTSSELVKQKQLQKQQTGASSCKTTFHLLQLESDYVQIQKKRHGHEAERVTQISWRTLKQQKRRELVQDTSIPSTNNISIRKNRVRIVEPTALFPVYCSALLWKQIFSADGGPRSLPKEMMTPQLFCEQNNKRTISENNLDVISQEIILESETFTKWLTIQDWMRTFNEIYTKKKDH